MQWTDILQKYVKNAYFQLEYINFSYSVVY